MRTVFRLIMAAVLLGALAVGASSAASAPVPNTAAFTIAVAVNPTTIARGGTVAASITITNHTEADAVAQVTFRIVPPKPTAAFGTMTFQKTFTVSPFATAVWNRDVKIPLKGPIGPYQLTATAPGADAPAFATLNVT
jgi:hypothetical protein